jgi:hypothetical protein
MKLQKKANPNNPSDTMQNVSGSVTLTVKSSLDGIRVTTIAPAMSTASRPTPGSLPQAFAFFDSLRSIPADAARRLQAHSLIKFWRITHNKSSVKPNCDPAELRAKKAINEYLQLQTLGSCAKSTALLVSLAPRPLPAWSLPLLRRRLLSANNGGKPAFQPVEKIQPGRTYEYRGDFGSNRPEK